VTSPAPPAPGTTDGPASFTVTYDITRPERVRATRYVVSRQPGMAIVYGAIPFLALVDAVLKLQRDGRWSPGGYLPVLGAVALLLAFGVYVEPWLQVRRLTRKHPQLDAPISLTIDASGVAVTSGLGGGSLIWSLIPQVASNGEFLFVYVVKKTQAQFVPLRALSQEQVDAFWWVVGRWAPHLVRHSRRA
jgi:hypothetical protein